MKRRTVSLEPYEGTWSEDDPDAGFRSIVAEYSRLDPLTTLETLGRSKNIPVGALVNFVLGRYAASGSEALLATGPLVVHQMDEIVAKAEIDDSDDARLEAYHSLRTIISWLKVPMEGGRPN